MAIDRALGGNEGAGMWPRLSGGARLLARPSRAAEIRPASGLVKELRVAPPDGGAVLERFFQWGVARGRGAGRTEAPFALDASSVYRKHGAPAAGKKCGSSRSSVEPLGQEKMARYFRWICRELVHRGPRLSPAEEGPRGSPLRFDEWLRLP